MKKKHVNKAFFQDFTEKEINEVVELAEIISYPAGSDLFKRGDESNAFYIISTGELEVFSFERGEKVTIAIIKSGSVVGEIGFMDGNERSASAKAITDLVTLKISREAFTNLENVNIKLAIKLLLEIESILADRLRNSDKLLVDYQTVKVDVKFLEDIEIKPRQTI